MRHRSVSARFRLLFALLSSAFLLAACTVDTGVGSHGAPIVDGERTDGNEQATVAVLNRRGGLCTGTLVAPRVVLTAKHCVQRPGAEGPDPASNFIIGVGDNIRRLDRTYGVTDVVTTPGVYYDNRGLSGAIVGIDVAVVTTATIVEGVTPVPVHRGDPGELIGETVRAVGFGQVPGGSAGLKYRTTNSVRNVVGNVIYMNPTICQGDSGGPLFTIDPEEVVGVASFGTGECGTGMNGHNTVDRFLDMIDDAIRASGVCVGDGEEVCDGEDNDCDDLFDEDCARVGENCIADADCVTLDCLERDGAGSFCTQACDPLRPFSSCPPGMYCGHAGGCDGQCVFGEPGEGMNEAPCEDATDCASLFCIDPGDGTKRCLDPCRGDAGTCFAGDACAAPPGSCGGCVPAARIGELRGLGEICEADEDCRSGICFTEESASYCSADCEADSDCSDGFHCRAAAPGEPERCVRGNRGGVGSACIHNPDCADGLFCADRGDVRWCTSFCASDEECPSDFMCVEVDAAAGISICVPDSGVVGATCTGPEECISGVCEATGVGGETICTRECSADAPCAPGYECRRSDDGAGAYCSRTLEPEGSGGGGCAAGGAGRAGMGALWMMSLGMVWMRRRRARLGW